MELNIHILMNELEHVSGYRGEQDYLDRKLSFYTLYQPGCVLRRDTLYLMESADQVLDIPELESGTALLFLAGTEPLAGDFPYGCSWICMDGSLTADALLSRLEEIFEKYNRWEQGLSAVLSGERSIEALCRLSLPIFNSPVMVHNREYELMGYAEAGNASFSYSLLQEGTNYLDRNITDELFFRSDYLTTLEFVTPQYWSNEGEEFISIYSNIFDENGEYWGRIVIDGVNITLTDGHLALLSVFTETVRALAVRHSGSRFNAQEAFKNYALEYLRSPSEFDADKLLMAMRLAGWKRSGPFFCVCMELTETGQELHSAAYESVLFDHQLHGYLSLEYEDRLLLLCNLGLGLEGRDEECRRLAYIVRDNLFKSGISTEFSDFFQFPDYYRQAEAALYSGKECSSTQWLFKFEDYALHYVLNCGADTLPVRTLIPASILELIRYDRTHDTSYYKTLLNYIEFDSHTAKAIDDLYIHRNTFKSRMKKIRELLDMDLDSPQERLYLMLIFRILKRYPELAGEQEVVL